MRCPSRPRGQTSEHREHCIQATRASWSIRGTGRFRLWRREWPSGTTMSPFVVLVIALPVLTTRPIMGPPLMTS